MPRTYGRARPDPFMVALQLRPMTDATRIVFPWDMTMKCFSKLEYNQTVYGSHITLMEIDAFFAKISACPNYQINNPIWALVVGSIIILVGLIVMMILIYSGNTRTAGGTMFLPFIIMPAFMIVGFAFLCWAALKRNKSLAARQ